MGYWDKELTVAVAELGCATIAQLALYLGWTVNKVYDHARNAFEHHYIDKCYVNRSQLAQEPSVDHAYGTAPDIFILDAPGRAFVEQVRSKEQIGKTPTIHDKTPFAAHHLLIRDVHVWLKQIERIQGYEGIQEWEDEPRPRGVDVKPDGYFRFKLQEREFGMFLEADRGTMTALDKWAEKLRDYAPFFAAEREGSLVQQVTGLPRVRVLVVTLSPERRDKLWKDISGVAPRYGIRPGRFLVCERDCFQYATFAHPLWRSSGEKDPVTLIPTHTEKSDVPVELLDPAQLGNIPLPSTSLPEGSNTGIFQEDRW